MEGIEEKVITALAPVPVAVAIDSKELGIKAAFPASKDLLLGKPCNIEDVLTRETAISYAISLPKAVNEMLAVDPYTVITSVAPRVIPRVKAVESDAPTVMS